MLDLKKFVLSVLNAYQFPFLKKTASVGSSQLVISPSQLPRLSHQSEYAFHIFLVSDWLTGLSFRPVSEVGGRRSRCIRKTAGVALSAFIRLQ